MEENEKQDQEQAPQEQAAASSDQPQAEKTYSQAEVNAMITARLAREKAKQQAPAPVQPKVEQPQTKSNNNEVDQIALLSAQVSQLTELMNQSQQKSQYEKAVSGHSLDDAQSKIAATLYKSDKDAFQSYLSSVGQPAAPAATFGGIEQPKAVQANDVSDYPIEWSSDDIARMQKDGTFLERLKGAKKSTF